MSIVETTVAAARNPVKKEVSEGWDVKKRDLTHKFLSGNINLDDYRSQQLLLSVPDWAVSLPYPGPLYGLLRRIGVDQNETQRITYEERDHYDVARKAGIYNKVHIEFIEKDCEDPTDDLSCGEMSVFISYFIPRDKNPEEVKEIIRNILLAPPEPSEYDLAKLPEGMR